MRPRERAVRINNGPKEKTGGSEWYHPQIPKTTPEDLHKARLRLVESGLRQEASMEDIKEVLDALGDLTPRGIMSSGETL